MKKRQEGLPKTITDIAWEAQRRLHHRYTHLTRVGKKKSQVAVTAVARELAGFVWAIARQVKPVAPQPLNPKQQNQNRLIERRKNDSAHEPILNQRQGPGQA